MIPTHHETTKTRKRGSTDSPQALALSLLKGGFVSSWFRVVGARRVEVIGGSILALVFLAFQLFYLPASLEDLDSINFALGVRHFDVAEHQPHPPGYPLFILAAKGAHALMGSEAHALAAVSVVAGALGVIAIAALFHAWDGL